MGKRSRYDDAVSAADSRSSVDYTASPAKVQEVTVEQRRSGIQKMQCLLPPHGPLSFDSTDDFDVHYTKDHTNRCSSCGRNFPSAHYLALHIDENHNPVREAIAASGERTYACFIEDCDRKCSTPQKRRLHLIDKHMFPKAYNFRIIDQGIDGTSSLLVTGQRRRLSTSTQSGHQRQSSMLTPALSSNASVAGSSNPIGSGYNTSSSVPLQDPKSSVDVKVDDLEKSMAALRFVPPSVQARQRLKQKEN